MVIAVECTEETIINVGARLRDGWWDELGTRSVKVGCDSLDYWMQWREWANRHG
jgi:hypothetical protein